MIFFWHDRPRVGGPMCSTPPSGHYNIFKKIGLYGFFVAQQYLEPPSDGGAMISRKFF